MKAPKLIPVVIVFALVGGLPPTSFSAWAKTKKPRSKVRYVVVDGERWSVAVKNRVFKVRVEGPARVEVRVRALASRRKMKNRPFNVKLATPEKRMNLNVPVLEVPAGIRYAGLKRSVPTRAISLIKDVDIPAGMHVISLVPERTCLVQVKVRKVPARKREAPSVTAEKKGSFLNVKAGAGPLYFSQTGFTSPGFNLWGQVYLRSFSPRLQLGGTIEYMFYQAAYFYQDPATVSFYPRTAVVNESRITFSATGDVSLVRSSTFKFSLGGGYTGDYFLNNFSRINFQGIVARGRVFLNVSPTWIFNTGASVAFRLGGTSYTPAFEGLPRLRVRVPLVLSIPLRWNNVNMRVGYRFEYLDFEYSSRFYNVLMLALAI